MEFAICVFREDQVLLQVGKGKLATEELIWHFYQSSQTFIRDGWVGAFLIVKSTVIPAMVQRLFLP